MHIADFDYHLPPELIAQQPARPRDASRMLVLRRSSGEIEHRRFRDLHAYLRPDDLVVLNDTRVIRARLRGRRHPGGGRAEVLLLSERADGTWDALVTPGRRLQPGRHIVFGDGELRAEVVARTPASGRLLRFYRGAGSTTAGPARGRSGPASEAEPRCSAPDDVRAALARLGEVPFPPYIHASLADEDDYQTVYARTPGASAAPTAGLHFTPAMLQAVRPRVRAVAYVTLHIGLATFRPIHADNVEDHDMHAERYAIPESTARLASSALSESRRIVAVGTSTARALEAAAAPDGTVRPGSHETDLFIRPGYRFRAIGALLTNFHMPRSTLLLLVCAFAGRDRVLHTYRQAVEQKYRFLSFGDAMLII